MPKTLVKNARGQIIGGTFSDRQDAEEAVLAFRELGLPYENIQVTTQLSDKERKQAYSDLLMDREIAETQAAYFDKAIRAGKTLVVIYDVVDPAPIIDIFDKYKADYNPDGSRNAREDVSGMTAGAVIGTAAGGAVGALVAGPVGAMAGAAAGAVIGGGTGAAAGKAAEHNK